MNKIGSVKIVDGFTFTLVDKDKHSWMVEITKEGTDFSRIETVGHNTWKSGKFKKILRVINPRPKKVKEVKERKPRGMKPKTINDVVFKVLEKNKETKRVKVIAEGFEGIHEMSLSTWYRGRFYKNAMKVLKKVVDRIIEKSIEMGLIPLDVVVSCNSKEIGTDELKKLRTTYNLRQLKKEYKRLAKKFHTDNLDTGNVEMFKLVKKIYDVRKLCIETNLEMFGYDDPRFKDLVDIEEEFYKGWHNIRY